MSSGHSRNKKPVWKGAGQVMRDEKSAYFRLRPAEMEPLAMYRAIKGLLRV